MQPIIKYTQQEAFHTMIRPENIDTSWKNICDIESPVLTKLNLNHPEARRRITNAYTSASSSPTSGQHHPNVTDRFVLPEPCKARTWDDPALINQMILNGKARADPSAAPGSIVEKVLKETLMTGVSKDQRELFWFGNKMGTLGSNFSDSEKKFFKSLNGIWVKVEADSMENPNDRRKKIARVDISSQNDTAMTPTQAEANLANVYKALSPKAKKYRDVEGMLVGVITRGWYDAYEQYLISVGDSKEAEFTMNGISGLKYLGLHLYCEDEWDEYLEDVAGQPYQHRGLFYVKSNIILAHDGGLGTTTGDLEGNFPVKFWYSQDDEVWNSAAYWKQDQEYRVPEYMVSAY